MSAWNYNSRIDGIFFLIVLVFYLFGQVLIGTYLPESDAFHFDAPADIDFLYYAGIINQMQHSFPPQNPAYGGVLLSQSFVQYYPTALLSFALNPYVAMRVMNIVWLLVCAYFLRRYFPRGWGVGLAMISAGSVGFGLINALGIDLVARGFNHFPFFIALIISLFERRKLWLKYLCLFLLGWFHSFSGLLVLLYFGINSIVRKFEKESLIEAGICLSGLVTAASITLGVADKPVYFPFVEGFGVDLTDLWMHALPALILVGAAKKIKIYILFLVAFLFGLLFHYNPFFPVFILYFAGAWAAQEIIKNRSAPLVIPVAMAGLMLIGFLFGGFDKYDSRRGNFVPLIDGGYAEAIQWLEENTPAEAVILMAPLESGRTCRLMEKRAVYLGFIPHIAHLGIDWRDRGQKILNYFLKPSVYMAETDYVVYGPWEHKLFPNFNLSESPVYRKGSVEIWKINH
jgi:hypothetical protein